VNHFGARPPVAVSGDSDTSCGEFLMSTRSYPTSVLVGALSSSEGRLQSTGSDPGRKACRVSSGAIAIISVAVTPSAFRY